MLSGPTLLSRFDSDASGSLTRRELCSGLFTELDTDGSGQLSAAELEAGLAPHFALPPAVATTALLLLVGIWALRELRQKQSPTRHAAPRGRTLMRQDSMTVYRQKSDAARACPEEPITPKVETPLERARSLAARYHAQIDVINHGVKALMTAAGGEASMHGALPHLRRNPKRPLLPKYRKIDAVTDNLAAMQHLLQGRKSKQLETALASTHQLLKLNLGKLSALDEAHPFKKRLSTALHECDDATCASKTPSGATMLTDLTELNDALYGLIGDLAIAIQAACDADADYDPFSDEELRSMPPVDLTELSAVLS